MGSWPDVSICMRCEAKVAATPATGRKYVVFIASRHTARTYLLLVVFLIAGWDTQPLYGQAHYYYCDCNFKVMVCCSLKRLDNKNHVRFPSAILFNRTTTISIWNYCCGCKNQKLSDGWPASILLRILNSFASTSQMRTAWHRTGISYYGFRRSKNNGVY